MSAPLATKAADLKQEVSATASAPPAAKAADLKQEVSATASAPPAAKAADLNNGGPRYYLLWVIDASVGF